MMEDQRCPECDTLMCSYRYKHNGIDKVGYRCPSPHGLRSTTKKDISVLEFVRPEDLPDSY